MCEQFYSQDPTKCEDIYLIPPYSFKFAVYAKYDQNRTSKLLPTFDSWT